MAEALNSTESAHEQRHGNHRQSGNGHRHDRGVTCPVCGNVSEGAGHDRTMGKVGIAVVGGFFIVNSYLLERLLPDQTFAAMFSAIIGAATLAGPIIFTAVKDLVKGQVYMNELVALAILAAMAGGDFQTAGLIAFFLLATIIIESRTASGAQRSIEELVKLTPNTARRIVNGREVEVQALELKVGDVISVRPGENFPVDGRVIKGESAVNQASITGESLPLDKAAGDDVFAGTQNLTGQIEMQVTKVGEDTTLGKVKEMILAAESSRTPIVRIIDRYAGYYTPTILMLAGVTWSFTQSMERVITLMVIACPCAIVLATPTAVVAAVAAAARLGIFIKNISHLELAAKIRAFIFDKTGTLTDGILSVAKLSPIGKLSPAELLKIAASAEVHSNHPTAVALQKLAQEAGVELDKIESAKEEHGKGVEATVGRKLIRVGRAAWLEKMGIAVGTHHDDESHGMSVVYVASGDKIIGWIGFKDKLRNEAPQILSDLKTLGIRHCAMVTGDRESVAKTIAASLQTDEYRAGCLPEDKVEYVETIKKSARVAFVGDGVNDAPALAAGDLSIAMGAIGSDIAVNSASIALMTNDLRRVPMLIFLSRKMRTVINQNLSVGLLFVLGGMVLAAFGKLGPVQAAILHTLSTLLIIFNSARLVRVGEELTLEESRAARRE
ncbi:MAG: cation-translocating P-type ATPase [Victivallaceae bacterium]|nr:cation-translocating P-type ATPase [Victivallaceae bacterium]